MKDSSGVQALVERLLSFQNQGGGWPYNKGSACVEPTAFAVLALQSLPGNTLAKAIEGGLIWLLKAQKSSGGWSPEPAVEECTAVTSVATLALLNATDNIPSQRIQSALNWIAQQVYRDDLSLSLLLARLLHQPPPRAPGSVPWFPGTAGWVWPTSMSLLALMSGGDRYHNNDWRQIATSCSSYLLSRRCADGGWNHGGSQLRSEPDNSYPETTGLALLALRSAKADIPTEAISLAQKFLQNPESIEGLSFLQMSLMGTVKGMTDPPRIPMVRTTRDIALRILSVSASQGRSPFLGPTP